MLDIERIFRDVIDTPESRRLEVEAAGERARQAFAFQRQRGGPTFGYGGSTLAGQIASQIPQNTESLRNTLVGLGVDSMKTQGENLADQLRGLDLTDPEAQKIAIQRVMAVDPASGAALEDAYVAREINRDRFNYANRERFPVGRDTYKNGTIVLNTDRSPDPIIIANGQRYSIADGTSPEKMAELMEAAEASGPIYAGQVVSQQEAARELTGMQAGIIGVAVDAGPSLKQARLALELIKEVGDGTAGVGGQLRRYIQDLTGEQLSEREIQEGRLNRLMATVVLSQLTTVFGTQFTEREGDKLADIEADISDDPRLNAQLIQDAIDVTETFLKRGIAANAGLPQPNEFLDLDMRAMLQGTDQYEVTPELIRRNINAYSVEPSPSPPPGARSGVLDENGEFLDPTMQEAFEAQQLLFQQQREQEDQ